jgi:hypothetical protein
MREMIHKLDPPCFKHLSECCSLFVDRLAREDRVTRERLLELEKELG